MKRSHFEVFLHFVWRTKNREPMIHDETEDVIKRIVNEKCKQSRVRLLAFGSVSDHLHILVSFSPDLRISEFVAGIKGASSYHINHRTNHCLYWQDGYGCMSVDKVRTPSLKEYIENQKQHHGETEGLSKEYELDG